MNNIELEKKQLEEVLNSGLEQLNLSLSQQQIDFFLSYVELLCKWGKAYNLTAIHSKREILIRHILDSLAIYPYLNGDQCLDVGTGAGLPGIPLSLVFPEKQFCLLDSNSKKIRFVRQVLIELHIRNIHLQQHRVESLIQSGAARNYTCIVTRAFSSLKNIVEMCYSLKSSGGSIVAMKGKITDSEIAELQQLPFELNSVNIEPLEVPYLDEERHLVIIH